MSCQPFHGVVHESSVTSFFMFYFRYKTGFGSLLREGLGFRVFSMFM